MLNPYSLQELKEELLRLNLIDPFLSAQVTSPSGFSPQSQEDEGDFFCDLLPFGLTKEPLERYVNETLQPGFQNRLFQMIDARGLTDVEVYRHAQIDRRLFSKIRSDPSYRPSKGTALALAVGMRLNRRETEELLACAGLTLSDSLIQDVVVRYFIEHEIFDVMEINEALEYFGQPPL